MTAADYEADLEANLEYLLNRLKSGCYRAPPVRRHHIPKADGTKRPLGIPTFEDKVAQRAILMLVEPLYEQDFLPCSYGFRPGRSSSPAMDRTSPSVSASRPSRGRGNPATARPPLPPTSSSAGSCFMSCPKDCIASATSASWPMGAVSKPSKSRARRLASTASRRKQPQPMMGKRTNTATVVRKPGSSPAHIVVVNCGKSGKFPANTIRSRPETHPARNRRRACRYETSDPIRAGKPRHRAGEPVVVHSIPNTRQSPTESVPTVDNQLSKKYKSLVGSPVSRVPTIVTTRPRALASTNIPHRLTPRSRPAASFKQLRVRLETLCLITVPCEPPCEESDVGDKNPCLCGGD